AELEQPLAGQIRDDDLLSAGEAFRAARDFREARKVARLAKTAKQQMNRADEPSMAPPEGNPGERRPDLAKPDMAKPGKVPQPMPGLPQQIYLAEAKARLDAALAAPTGFAERLVWFWSNHFCVSADKGPVRPLCGAFEREAIRPHINGLFEDMLLAVETHPAMLFYLDNVQSTGPHSI